MIEYEKREQAGVITINRPEARNAVNDVVAQGIERALDEIESDAGIRVGILTGVPPVFSAGADLKLIGSGKGSAIATARGGFAGLVRRERTKPLIAAVDGPALAGGTEIVLACDLVVASTNATFGIPEAKRCLVAGGGGLFRLPRRIPFNIAMECALTGDPIDAARAAAFGLVNQLCGPGEVIEAALDLARRISACAPASVHASRKAMIEGALADDVTAWNISVEAATTAMGSVDFHEGVQAFIEKRPPRWSDV